MTDADVDPRQMDTHSSTCHFDATGEVALRTVKARSRAIRTGGTVADFTEGPFCGANRMWRLMNQDRPPQAGTSRERQSGRLVDLNNVGAASICTQRTELGLRMIGYGNRSSWSGPSGTRVTTVT